METNNSTKEATTPTIVEFTEFSGEVTVSTVDMPVSKVREAERAIKSVQRRATKLGIEIGYTIGDDEYPVVPMIEEPGSAGRMVPKYSNGASISCVEFTINTPVLKFNGWEFVAVIELTDEINLVHSNFEIDPMWRETGDRCDHCDLSRGRKTLVVVRHETEGTKIVGKACAKDFIGHDDALTITNLLARIGGLIEMWRSGGGSSEDMSFAPVDILDVTVQAIKQFGWSPKSGSGTATASIVFDWVFRKRTLLADGTDLRHDNPADTATAAAALEWAKTVDAGNNDYLNNLKAVANMPVWTYKRFGLGCSIIAAYERAMGQRAEREAEAAARAAAKAALPESSHIGAVKDRLEIEASVTRTRIFDNAYGETLMVEAVTDSGDIVVWWASSCPSDIKVGVRIVGKATVKDHKEFRGDKQTVVTRWSYSIVEVAAA